MGITVKHVGVDKIVNFRHQHLLPNHQLSECEFPEDISRETFHLAAYKKSNLVGIASFLKQPSQLFESKHQYRLRQMAVCPEERRSGIGCQVIKLGFEVLRERNCHLLWCNARQEAFEFYERLEFKFIGEFFEVPRVGPHKVMFFDLKT